MYSRWTQADAHADLFLSSAKEVYLNTLTAQQKEKSALSTANPFRVSGSARKQEWVVRSS